MTKISIDDALYQRARKAAAAAGYSSVEEFLVHCLEKELKQFDEAEEQVSKQLRGLGYIE